MKRKTDPPIEELKKVLGPKARNDKETLLAYSTDASLYKIMPRLVVSVESEEDIKKVLRFSNRHKIPVTPRGAGTGLAGQALGPGLILDFSGYKRILEVNPKEKWVRAQVGTVNHDLNKALRKYGLMFAPDPSSGDTCQIGGMIGNNASGSQTVMYGATKDHVLEMEVYLADGKKITTKRYRMDSPELQELLKDTRIKKLKDMLEENKDLILEKRKVIKKNTSGFNVFDMAGELDKDIFDLNKLFVGSEGTLGIVTEAKLNLVELPENKVTLLLYFKNILEVGLASNEIAKINPSKLELADTNSLDLIGREDHGIPDDADAMLILEFTGDNLERKVRETKEICAGYKLSGEGIKAAYDPVEQDEIWAIRRALLPILYTYDEKLKPLPFVEDSVVPVAQLPVFMKFLDSIFKEYGIKVAMFGHIGDGNCHIRPLADITSALEQEKIRELYWKVYRKAVELGGTTTGEHGDGRLRAPMLPEVYGKDVYDLLLRIKKRFDPDNIMNPDVKFGYENFLSEDVDFSKIQKLCVTCGKCNSMCPAFAAMAREEYSARGFFRMIHEGGDYENYKHMIDYCFNCKSCYAICPAGVNVAEEIIRIRREHPDAFTGLVFNFKETLDKNFFRLTRFAAHLQFIWDNPLFRGFLEIVSRPFPLKIRQELFLPQLRKKSFAPQLKGRKGIEGRYAFFHGCAAEQLEQDWPKDLVEVFERSGINLEVPEQKCCGTPPITYGHQDIAVKNAKINIDSMLKFDAIITGCASCTLMLKEYPKLLKNEPDYAERAEDLAAKVMDATEFLAKRGLLNIFEIDTEKPLPLKKVTYHDPCHLKACGITREPREVLKSIPGIEFVEMADADKCCAYAGTYKLKKYDASQKAFERKKLGIEESGAALVATCCPSCILGLQDGTEGKVEAVHVMTLLNRAYKDREALS